MGRSSDRENSSRGDACLFYFHYFSEKDTVFWPVDVSMIFRTFFEIFDERLVFPKMTHKCLGVLGGHPRHIPSHICPIWAKNEKSHKNMNYENPYKNQVNFVATCSLVLG